MLEKTNFLTQGKGVYIGVLWRFQTLHYNLRKPKDIVEPTTGTSSTLSSGYKTLNSIQAGLMDKKSKRAARREYQNPNPAAKPKIKSPVKPKCGTLQVKHHRIPVRRKRDHKIKCPVCSKIFKLIKDLNNTDTAPNLRQHQRGKHGRGWRVLCGKHYDWPAKMYRHKKSCEKC